MRRSAVRPAAEPALFGEINTTPLIDVMLVLLIMMILTVPITTHKVPLDLPQAGPTAGAPRPTHRLALDPAGALSWDGVPIAIAELPRRLAAHVADPAAPQLTLRAEAETPYLRFDETLATIQRAGVTRLGLVDNGRFVSGD
ncbi:biopolymer transporter ExbD [Sphingomonas sp. 1P06PA]|uniref:ExbD/TolR family protein n=1 Tax=Sphingomonas sp. 1P06PA TaxID=554121 RepID=UPI0039A5DFC2